MKHFPNINSYKMKTRIIISAFISAVALTAMISCSNKDNNYGPAESTGSPEAIQNIMTRTSVRQYTGKAIPDDTVTIMLKAAMAAPSAINKQPWKFVVVKDQELRDKIGAAVQGVGDKTKTAGSVILVCGDKTKFIEQAPEYWVQDCSAATENLLLAANALGLGAVWCGVYPVMDRVKDVTEILGLPSNLVPLNIVTIGYPTAIQNPKDKWNPENIITI